MTDFVHNSEQETEKVKYAILMETNAEECESWYYFIKYNGNEKKLKHLNSQLNQIEMYLLDDLSTFDLDLEHLVSEQTAKEMTKIELNSVSFHRKFDGVLQTVNIGLKRKDPNEKRIERVYNKLAFGSIEDFIDKEDIDPEDMVKDENKNEQSDDDEDLVPLPMGSPRIDDDKDEDKDDKEDDEEDNEDDNKNDDKNDDKEEDNKNEDDEDDSDDSDDSDEDEGWGQ